MERTGPIIWFERCYLASFVLGAAGAVLNWRAVNPGALQLSVIIGLLLWYGVMYRHSQVCRWLVFGSLIVSTVQMGLLIAAIGYDPVLGAIGVVILGLNAAAAGFLLNASAWFAKPAD